MTDSYIEYNSDGSASAFVGPDAIELFRAAALRSAIGLAAQGICPTRGFTLTKGLKMATQYTGKKYKRSEYSIAMTDLRVWCDEMEAALPIQPTN